MPFMQEFNPDVHSSAYYPDEIIGTTVYDMQTNGSVQNRIYLFDDGVIGASWNMGFIASAFTERGTGVNYFDGTGWGPQPTERIESEKTGWPSYAPYGTNGEIVMNHTMYDGLDILTRDNKGEGTWLEWVLPGPTGHEDISWPRMVTNGTDHQTIHTIYTTYSVYEELDYALLYSRSEDGGTSWDPVNTILDGTGSDEYFGFGGDDYAMAEPVGETIAFVVGSPWIDMFLMKSENNGET